MQKFTVIKTFSCEEERIRTGYKVDGVMTSQMHSDKLKCLEKKTKNEKLNTKI